MNKVFLIGNLTRDPELNETQSGISVCRFTIAVGRNYTQGDGERQTDFFNCVAWRNLAETIAQYCKKGNKVAVTGSIQLRNYEDNQGIKRTAVDIITQDIEFLTPKAREDEVMEEPTPRRKRPTMQPMDDDSDIPF
jgi:single-strand DNA-binding protein